MGQGKGKEGAGKEPLVSLYGPVGPEDAWCTFPANISAEWLVCIGCIGVFSVRNSTGLTGRPVSMEGRHGFTCRQEQGNSFLRDLLPKCRSA